MQHQTAAHLFIRQLIAQHHVPISRQRLLTRLQLCTRRVRPDGTHSEDLLMIAPQPNSQMIEPILLEGLSDDSEASIGIAHYPGDGQDVGQLLQRADQLLVEGVIAQDPQPRITFLLHGPVLRDLLRQSYLKNRELVDLAASLSALQVVEIKACQTWMAGNGVNAADLQPFIETVPFAAGEVERLLAEKHYIRF